MPRLDIDLVANVARLQQDMNRAVGLVDKGFRDIKRAGDQVRNVLGVFGAGFGVFQFTRFIKQQVDAADALKDLHEQTGIAVGTLAGLDLVARKSGTSLESLATANARLSRFVADGQAGIKENQKLIAALGLTARDPTERLYQMADAIKAIEDPTLRLGVAQKVMGRSAAENIPALLQGGEALRRQVEEGRALSGITDENVAAADRFNDELEDMQANLRATGLTIGTAVIPFLNDLTKQFNEAIRVSGGFGAALRNAAILNFNPQFFGITNDLQALQEELEKGILTPRAREAVKAQIEFLKAQQREAALALNAGGDLGREGLDRSAVRAPDAGIQRIVCEQMGGLWDGSVCNLEAGKFVDRLNRQIAGIYGDVFSALREQAKQGGFLDLVEGDIRRAEAAKDAADAAKYKNEQADIAIKADIENKKSADDFLKSLRLTNEDLAFQATLYGRAASEQEKLIAVRRIDLDLAERLSRLDQEAPSFENDVAALEANAAAARRTVQQNLDELREVSRSFETGIREGMNQVIDDSTNAAAQVSRAFVNAFSSMEDHLVEFILRGKLDFKGFVDSILADILRIQIQQNISAPLAAFFGGLFGGGRATGGPVTAGVPYMVGEKGPELFVPQNSGKVVPNDGLAGMSITVNQNFALGVAPTVRAELMQQLPLMTEHIKNSLADAKLRGGPFSAAFG